MNCELIYLPFNALAISMLIMGWHFLAESILLNIFNIELNRIYEYMGKISLPLIVCPTCMTSLYGIPLTYIFTYYTGIYFIATLLLIAFFNYVFSKIIP